MDYINTPDIFAAVGILSAILLILIFKRQFQILRRYGEMGFTFLRLHNYVKKIQSKDSFDMYYNVYEYLESGTNTNNSYNFWFELFLLDFDFLSTKLKRKKVFASDIEDCKRRRVEIIRKNVDAHNLEFDFKSNQDLNSKISIEDIIEFIKTWIEENPNTSKRTLILLGGILFNMKIIKIDNNATRIERLHIWEEMLGMKLYDDSIMKNIIYYEDNSSKIALLKLYNEIELIFKEMSFTAGIEYLNHARNLIKNKKITIH